MKNRLHKVRAGAAVVSLCLLCQRRGFSALCHCDLAFLCRRGLPQEFLLLFWMPSRGLPFTPSLYTTALVYIAVNVAVVSFISSYYDVGVKNLTLWAIDKLDEVSESPIFV